MESEKTSPANDVLRVDPRLADVARLGSSELLQFTQTELQWTCRSFVSCSTKGVEGRSFVDH